MRKGAVNRYEDLLDCAPFGYATFDERGRITGINSTGARLLGLERDALTGVPMTTFAMERTDVEELLSHFRRCRQGENQVCSLITLRTQKGTAVPVRMFSQPRIKDGEMTCFSTLTDLSEQHRAERELRDSEERFSLLNEELERRVEVRTIALRNSQMLKNAVLDAISLQIVVVDAQGVVVEANASWLDSRKHGTCAGLADVILGENYLECCESLIKSGDDAAMEAYEVITAVIRGEHRGGTVEYRRTNAKGEERWICLSVTPLRDNAGAVLSHEDKTTQRELEHEILEISEREKRRIGQDLHDGVCQHLSGVSMIARSLSERLSKTMPGEAAEVLELSEMIQYGGDQVRAISRGLHPVELDAGGLAGALQELAASSSKRVPTTFQCRDEVTVTDVELSTNLYRIAQEAVNNALRHAQAKRITIILRRTPSHLILAVEDDGAGISAKRESSRGMGLHIMRYRAASIGARLDFGNTPTGGTWVRCLLPVSALGH